MNARKTTIFSGVATLLLLIPGMTAAQDIQVPVSKLVSEDLLSGTAYTLAPRASIERSRAIYTLDRKGESTRVTGTVSLLERANEIRAVQTLEAMKKTDVYTDALKNSAKGPLELGKSLVDEPVDTVTNAVKGFGGFLADVGYSVVSDDPSQENVAKTGLGFATAKRNFAHQLGVNPYSTYQPLQDALGEVAWTAVGGGLTVSAGFRAVTNTAGAVLTTTKTANTAREMVRDMSPRKLQNQNADTLQGMGVDEDLTETLLDNFEYDPETETRLVTALDSMDKVQGRPDFVARASLASSRNAAEEMRDWAELLAAYHALVKPAERLVVISSAPFIVDRDGIAHGIFPTDYVAWTDSLQAQITDFSEQIKSRGYQLGSILTTGVIAPRMRELLAEIGWSDIQDQAERTLRTE